MGTWNVETFSMIILTVIILRGFHSISLKNVLIYIEHWMLISNLLGNEQGFV